MSSHHIVREKQEPALLVLSLENFSREFLGQLLEWSPTIIATPDTFEKLNSEAIKVDWLVAEEENGLIQNDVKFIPSKLNSYLDDAIGTLIINEYKAVNIISNKVLSLIFDTYADRINLVIYTGNQKTFAVKSGYEKWMPAGETVRIYQIPSDLKTEGLNQVTDTDYTTTKNGIVSLKFIQAQLLITEFL